jgi:hypothetical protein
MQLSSAQHMCYAFLCLHVCDASTESTIHGALVPECPRTKSGIAAAVSLHTTPASNVVSTRWGSDRLVLVLIADISLSLSGSERLSFLLCADREMIPACLRSDASTDVIRLQRGFPSCAHHQLGVCRYCARDLSPRFCQRNNRRPSPRRSTSFVGGTNMHPVGVDCPALSI